MQPLHRELRNALKQAHPGLSERDLERFDALSAQLITVAPHDTKTEARLRGEIETFIAEKMPHFREILQVFGRLSADNARVTRKILPRR